MARLAILVSKEGRFMRPLLDSAFFKEIKGLEIAGIVSSSPTAPALVRGRHMKAACYVVERQMFPNDASYGMALLQMLRDIDTDFVVLDDFEPSLGQVAKYYAGKLIGVRMHAVECTVETTVYLADQTGGVGEVLAVAVDAPKEDDTSEAFKARVKQQSVELLMAAVKEYCEK